jgi:hypothetical protein
MSIGLLILTVLALVTWANWTLHYYTQLGTYALFPAVAGQTDGRGFVAYHRAYERRLPLTVYLPWSVLMLASVALLFRRPEPVGLPAAVVLLLLNASIAGLSLALAAPVHRRIDERGDLTPADTGALLRWNGVRLLAATASALLVAGLLLTSISAG